MTFKFFGKEGHQGVSPLASLPPSSPGQGDPLLNVCHRKLQGALRQTDYGEGAN